MSYKESLETFIYIGFDKLSLCVFEDVNKMIFEEETIIENLKEKKDLSALLDKFLEENIIKLEKKINKFVNEINLIIFDINFLLIQASIKSNGRGNEITDSDLNHLLFDLKQQIKENNPDKTITQMRINNFLLDKKKYFKLMENFECKELCLQIDFICLPNKVISDVSQKIKKYQISVDKIFSAKYLRELSIKNNESECQIAARLKYEQDENEVHIIKKISQKKGFFERFFGFFN